MQTDADTHGRRFSLRSLLLAILLIAGLLAVYVPCRAYLAGFDAVTGRSFEHRREWIRRRLELLASVFSVDVLTYAILSNHIHVVTRTRPDVVAQWSDQEVARRWLSVFPGRRLEEQLAEPTTADVDALAGNAQRMAEIRTRLSDLSWFMRALSEPIARLANKQDECTGAFLNLPLSCVSSPCLTKCDLALVA